ncbi:hypothetical protein SERLA73DRAFT_136938 [Serpula lacrymans var. lacrymans S7.3]|uniref:Uncharacterized protein n=2 Tax=Serpula lacrymans var. lacrymans TaxID=341189 RepID=F8PYD7_SERL3|nr:uncharacterized protein SERLADRAFT_467907 [Serpula lacrymans var. lacrymans S7.9]EGN98900.1 hypothetical protein SERLA73DRAFT_136938 [Serpula lacrymans var. lacrymans S7.3]EGO24494.1 hypothetical protein SERLADRAFT_467907 [Serpula lacrymans var. lacrymans S7.9]
MTLLGSVVGFSFFGLASRFGQLSIQKRNLMDNPGGHVLAMAVFGFAGYWAHQWDERAGVILAEKRAEITERRERRLARADI